MSLLASIRGQPDIAVANVVGSNVFNVLFILGVCALIVPLVISRQIWRREVPILIAVSLLLVVISLDGTISRPEAALLVLGLAAHVVSSVRASRRESADAQREAAHGEMLDRPVRGGLPVSAALVASGLAALVLGARSFVDGAVALARAAGLSEVVIGLTIVAVGTSLPEVVTFAYAAYLVLAATDHDALHALSAVMASFVVPLTAITIAVVLVRSLHLEHRARREASRPRD